MANLLKQKACNIFTLYGHALNLAMKQRKVCSDAMNIAFEITKLIKFSPSLNPVATGLFTLYFGKLFMISLHPSSIMFLLFRSSTSFFVFLLLSPYSLMVPLSLGSLSLVHGKRMRVILQYSRKKVAFCCAVGRQEDKRLEYHTVTDCHIHPFKL